MGFNPTTPVTLVGPAAYYQVVRMEINTPNVANHTGDYVMVTIGAFVNSTDVSPAKTSNLMITGSDLAILMSSVPTSGLSLYAGIKSATYSYLQSKNMLPDGKVV